MNRVTATPAIAIESDPAAIAALDWHKGDGLLPAIVQHASDASVLMLGYMNAAALQATFASGRVTFYSRSKQRLWTKGETSGHILLAQAIHVDCDHDTLLIRAQPLGPTCHTGNASCFGAGAATSLGFLAQLDALVATRAQERPRGSYTTRLFESGVRRIAQKVGEEGVETALAAVAQDEDALVAESADLVFHLLVLLRSRERGLADVLAVLAARHAL